MEQPGTLVFGDGDNRIDLDTLTLIPDNALAMLVMAHGAGADISHQHMRELASALAKQHIATCRFNLPFMQKGGGRVDSVETCCRVFHAAVQQTAKAVRLPIFVGGHSFGGRMSTHFALAPPGNVCGVVCFSFPLHANKKPATTRASHLPDVAPPMLFVNGTRDGLADQDLMNQLATEVPGLQIHGLHTADHSFKILKRTRIEPEDVYSEAARIAAQFISQVT